MNKKTLLTLLAVAVVAAGAYFIFNKPNMENPNELKIE